ncbi:phosphate ABC transporter substrate-binding protein [Agaribacterium haliotis]|uniref:phosphate ABC transporter substrate-binding protein n=1 Tax=Agaribacterium haliotis TaxID=2013869 RepID=UPI000BB57674|nr:phosphate ABC transporter substrate-binding protein [Agaribacterium haliotis]
MNKTFILLVLLALSFSASAEIAVIVSSASPISSADAKELERLYLGKSKKIGGSNAVPVNQKAGSSAASHFNQTVLGKSDSQVKAYWSKLVFTGKGTPPKEMPDDAAVIAEVSASDSSVGYVDAGAVNDSVKVIASY